MTLDTKGECYLLANPQLQPPYTPGALPDFVSQNPERMLQFFLSDFVPNSAAYMYWKVRTMGCEIKMTHTG